MTSSFIYRLQHKKNYLKDYKKTAWTCLHPCNGLTPSKLNFQMALSHATSNPCSNNLPLEHNTGVASKTWSSLCLPLYLEVSLTNSLSLEMEYMRRFCPYLKCFKIWEMRRNNLTVLKLVLHLVKFHQPWWISKHQTIFS